MLLALSFIMNTAQAQDYSRNPAQPLGPCEFRLGPPPASCASDATCHTGHNGTNDFIAPSVEGFCAWDDPLHPATVTKAHDVEQILTVMVDGEKKTVSVFAPQDDFYFYGADGQNEMKYGGVRIGGSPLHSYGDEHSNVIEFQGHFALVGRCNPDRGLVSADGYHPRLLYTGTSCSQH